eukprot:TRINITY_DN2012_c0_g1_i2.p1 TRINITY_DN2012_c0_g1~~TRINITY_DN2012_c0_g1_i2.p1  ORF type:complete len:110 (+),score=14.32 TRINITY_DN2012_c0_g1_i2:336-665(+)
MFHSIRKEIKTMLENWGTEQSDSEEDDHDNEDKEIRFGIGCHSGKHRSVATVERLASESDWRLKKEGSWYGLNVVIMHRDIAEKKSTGGKKRARQKARDNKYSQTYEGD